MQLVTEYGTGVIRTRIQGRFDAHSVGQYLADVAQKVDADHPTVVVDLTGVDFMDSSALSALVTTLKRAIAHGGDVVLDGVSSAAQIILELTRLDEVFTRSEGEQLQGATV